MTEITKDEITELMLSQMAEHDLFGIHFFWNDSTVRAGQVQGEKLDDGTVEIYSVSLSLPTFESMGSKADMIDVVYHEIAHCIAIRDHNCRGHGEIWKDIAIDLGAKPVSCGSFNLDWGKMPTKYTAICASCGLTHGFMRMGKNWKEKKYRCPQCDIAPKVTRNY